ncbi:MAG TPA: glycosyltransferase family 4 protein [Herpetosiphonaceae bacterium]
MRILVCTTQVPFARGGAELLSEGLRDALRAHGHEAEIVALPYSWTPRPNLIKSALAWRLLDLTQIDGRPVDAIICTKFPSYAASHPRKIVWLVHQHRQAYDWYGTALSDWGAQPGDVEARQQLQRLDRRTLGEAEALFAISRNVAARLRRFNDLDATPLYPPSHLMDRLRPGPFEDYILSISRLDAAKRIDLLLHGLARSRSSLRAIIAGRGPEQAALQRLARDLGLGDRVHFTGFVEDAQAVELFARCRAVYYAPVDEDYGFATIEAFAAGKPVLTTTDAGGVLEFVQHGVSGYVAAPDATALAAGIDQLADAQIAQRLGSANPGRVAEISWSHVVHTLLATPGQRRT